MTSPYSQPIAAGQVSLQIVILHICNDYGDSFELCENRQEALTKLAAYARQFWEDEQVGDKPPESDRLAIRRYFAHVERERAHISTKSQVIQGLYSAAPAMLQMLRHIFSDLGGRTPTERLIEDGMLYHFSGNQGILDSIRYLFEQFDLQLTEERNATS